MPAIPSAIPTEIQSFFDTLCGSEKDTSHVEAHADRKNIIYSGPGEGLSIVKDAYGGCHVDVKGLAPAAVDAAREAIHQLTNSFKESGEFNSVWIDVALPASAHTVGAIAPESWEVGTPGKGDLIYDYKENKVRIWQWINPEKECAIPAGATHNIGATALLVDTTAKKVLLVENVRRKGAWNLPGGCYDPDKDKSPCETALREAQEEGGFEVDQDAIGQSKLIGQIQFPYNQFAPAINQVWAFFVEGISEKTLNPPADEINRAEWVDVDAVVNCSDSLLNALKLGQEIQASCIAAVNNLGCEKIVDKGWMIVHVPKV